MKISLLNLLQSVDTPTVCNAIEVAQGKRGFNDFTRGTMLASDTKGVIVGYAVTAQIAAIEPPTEAVSVIRERRMSYYKAMSENVKPSIAVVEDLDYPNCIGAFWGEVNTTIHKGFGMSGALTNGVMRDLGDMAEGFPVVAGSIESLRYGISRSRSSMLSCVALTTITSLAPVSSIDLMMPKHSSC